jgi:hypothetical protein
MNTNIAMIISFNSRASEAWEGPREGGSFAGASEAWEGSREEREGFADRSKALEEVTGKNTGNKRLAGASEAWEGTQEIRKSP